MSTPSSRRGFFMQAAGCGWFLPGAVTSLPAFAQLLAAEPDAGESCWLKVREQFPFLESRVPMNAANLCPSPLVVSQRVTDLTADIDRDCSFNNREKFARFLESSREKVARQLSVSSDEIALVRNTSEANNVINNGLKLGPGDEVLLWDQNHPTNNVAWDVRAARFDFSVKRVGTPRQPRSVDELIDPFARALTPKTRVLAITHVSNVSGVRLPVRELCELAHHRGIHVHVDGAQTWGALAVNLRQLGCDSYAASAHKWFTGPKEVGVLYVRKDRISDIWPSIVAPGWGGNVEPAVDGALKFETLGQRDDAALAAIADAADFQMTIGMQRIEQRVAELAHQLKSALQEAGFDLVTPMDFELSGGVCVISAPGPSRDELVDRLYGEYGIAGAPTGGLRLCPHIYNTREHVDRAVEGVKALRRLIS